LVTYAPAKDHPQITFVLPRQDADNLPLNVKRLEMRRKLILEKMHAMISYVTSTHRCRMQMIQEYFNESSLANCNICDVCIGKRKKDNVTTYETLKAEILLTLKDQAMPIEKLESHLMPKDAELFVDVVREMVDEGAIGYDKVWQLRLIKK
jgi:ATP-dependent DNA helicase RecQ